MRKALRLAVGLAAVLSVACDEELGAWWIKDINDAGVLVGTMRDGPRYVSVRYENGQLSRLSTGGDEEREYHVQAIAADGTVAGYSCWATPDGCMGPRIVTWAPDGTLTVIDQPLWVRAMNDSKVMVGERYSRPAIYQNGTVSDLPAPALPFGFVSYQGGALDISESGAITGTLLLRDVYGNSREAAVRWADARSEGRVLDLDCAAAAINGAGTVAGTCAAAWGRPMTAVVWPADGSARQELQRPDDTFSVMVADINDHGVVVGSYALTVGESRAAKWLPDRTMVQLSEQRSDARRITNQGVIVGNGPAGATRFE